MASEERFLEVGVSHLTKMVVYHKEASLIKNGVMDFSMELHVQLGWFNKTVPTAQCNTSLLLCLSLKVLAIKMTIQTTSKRVNRPNSLNTVC